jgi:hypothetical protein
LPHWFVTHCTTLQLLSCWEVLAGAKFYMPKFHNSVDPELRQGKRGSTRCAPAHNRRYRACMGIYRRCPFDSCPAIIVFFPLLAILRVAQIWSTGQTRSSSSPGHTPKYTVNSSLLLSFFLWIRALTASIFLRRRLTEHCIWIQGEVLKPEPSELLHAAVTFTGTIGLYNFPRKSESKLTWVRAG